ncbi:MAG: metallophosphoesterase family protein [Caldisphaera sp.]|jgi:Icc-related predicted phosphoesterase|nr:metallophosphoesterase family protein [Caldisphaera sp.]PMP60950.1 MAG: hypothetical protein C0201_01130 [Caldisphaera sp.]
MKILHISDVHCDYENLNMLFNEEKIYDIAVFTGDFQCIKSAEIFLNLFKNPIAVTGNVDDVSIMRILDKNGVLLDGRIKTINNLLFAGIGGIDPRTNIISIKKKLETARKKIDILLSHNPPHGILDKTIFGIGAGLKEINEINSLYNPRLHLFGHIHESHGFITDKGITYVNPGPLKSGFYALIDINDNIIVELKKLSS